MKSIWRYKRSIYILYHRFAVVCIFLFVSVYVNIPNIKDGSASLLNSILGDIDSYNQDDDRLIENVDDNFKYNEKSLLAGELDDLEVKNRSIKNLGNQKYLQKLEMIEQSFNYEVDPTKNIPVVIVLCHKSKLENQMKNSSDELNALYNNKFFIQVKVLLKSISLATYKVTRVIIVTNTIIPIQGIKKFFDTWPLNFQRKLIVEYQSFTPRKECMDRKLFKLCASVRLFLHEILPSEDSIIYVDSDFIFLESPEKLAHHFQNFDSIQFVGAAPNAGFYEVPKLFISADYYYYGNTGISTGMLLMNLTRIKELKYNWTETVYSVCRGYKGRLALYDQGVYNIIFSEFEDNLYELDCRWSFNAYFCAKRYICEEALKYGNIYAVHGPSNTFFQYKSKKLKVLFQVFEKFNLGDPISELISNLKFNLEEIEIIQPDDTDGCKDITTLDTALLHPLMQKI